MNAKISYFIAILIVITFSIGGSFAQIETTTGPPPPAPLTVITDKQVYVVNDTIIISGKVENGGSGEHVLIHILDSKYDILNTYDTATATDGSYSLKIVADFHITGIYSISASLYNGYNTGASFMYISSPFILHVGDRNYSINYKITSGILDKIGVSPDDKSLSIHIVNASASNLTIELPRKIIDTTSSNTNESSFNVLIGVSTPDMREATFKEIYSNSNIRTLAISIPYDMTNPSGVWDIKIMGTQIIPEFPFVLPILVTGIASLILLYRISLLKF